MTNLQWCCETNLFATEALAEYLDLELPTVDLPDPRDSPVAAAHEHLVASLRPLGTGDDEFLRYKTRIAVPARPPPARASTRSATSSSDANLDDLHRLLGRRPDDWREGEAELERFVLADAADGRHDEELIVLFHRLHLRAQMLLGPPGSAMAQHLPIQAFRN